MIVVLDASAALEIALNNADAELFKSMLTQSDLVIAPDIYPAEITSAFWKYAHFSKIDEEKCQKGIEYCIELVDDYISTKAIVKEVFFESVKKQHSSYDIFYAVIARRNSGLLLTKDKKLKKIADEMGIKTLNHLF